MCEVREREDWEVRLQQDPAWAREVTARMRDVSGTASSTDELVTVTTDSIGKITHLELDERVREQPASTIAWLILHTKRTAEFKARNAMSELMLEIMGPDSRTGRMIRRPSHV